LQAPVSVLERAPEQELEPATVSQQAAQEEAKQPVSSHNPKKQRKQ
jgi:hypothetical protein